MSGRDTNQGNRGVADAACNPDKWQSQHEGRLRKLVEAGQLAAEVTLGFFGRAGLGHEAKADDSPVTVADRTAELEFRRLIAEAFPQDGILGEEHGVVEGTTAYRWVVDPIDGTKSFIGGVPMYSTLVALEYQGTPVAGGIWIPALAEVAVAAQGLGCWHRAGHAFGAIPQNAAQDSAGQGGAEWQRARVSARCQMGEAILVTTAVDSFEDVGALERFLRLQKSAWFTRTWGDGYGYLLVATGRADVMVDPIVNPWDVAAIRPVIEEAGGRFTDWSGVATTEGTNAVGSNGCLHDAALAVLR